MISFFIVMVIITKLFYLIVCFLNLEIFTIPYFEALSIFMEQKMKNGKRQMTVGWNKHRKPNYHLNCVLVYFQHGTTHISTFILFDFSLIFVLNSSLYKHPLLPFLDFFSSLKLMFSQVRYPLQNNLIIHNSN